MGILILFTVSLLFILNDENIVPFNYTIADVPTVSLEARANNQILYENFHYGDDNPTFEINYSGINIWDAVKDPLTYEEQILHIWGNIQYARSLIEKLSQYDQIPDFPTGEDAVDFNYLKFNRLMRVHYAYAMLMLKKGEFEKAANTLTQTYSIIKNIFPYSRYLISKTIYNAIANQHIQYAYNIASDPGCDKAILMMLEKNFSPLIPAQCSSREAYIGEYFYMKNCIEKYQDDVVGLFCEYCTRVDNEQCHSRWNYWVLKFFLTFNYKPQKSWNQTTNLFNSILSEMNNRPLDFSESKSLFEKNKFSDVLGNSAHYLMSDMSWLFIEPWTLVERTVETKVISDLFYLFLQHQLQVSFEMKDYITGESYMETERPGIHFSPGFDGVSSTKDDISLEGY